MWNAQKMVISYSHTYAYVYKLAYILKLLTSATVVCAKSMTWSDHYFNIRAIRFFAKFGLWASNTSWNRSQSRWCLATNHMYYDVLCTQILSCSWVKISVQVTNLHANVHMIQVTILFMPRQLSCRGMSKIVIWIVTTLWPELWYMCASHSRFPLQFHGSSP